MTVPEFLRSLPHDPALALAQIDGALLGESVDPRWTEDERLEVVAEQLRRRQAMDRKHSFVSGFIDGFTSPYRFAFGDRFVSPSPRTDIVREAWRDVGEAIEKRR